MLIIVVFNCWTSRTPLDNRFDNPIRFIITHCDVGDLVLYSILNIQYFGPVEDLNPGLLLPDMWITGSVEKSQPTNTRTTHSSFSVHRLYPFRPVLYVGIWEPLQDTIRRNVMPAAELKRLSQLRFELDSSIRERMNMFNFFHSRMVLQPIRTQ